MKRVKQKEIAKINFNNKSSIEKIIKIFPKYSTVFLAENNRINEESPKICTNLQILPTKQINII